MQLKDSSSQSNETTHDTMSAIETIQTWLANQIARQLNIKSNTIKVTEQLTRYGLDSIDSVTIVGEMEDWLGVELPSTLLWDYPTIEKTAHYLVNEMGLSPTDAVQQEPAAVANSSKQAARKGWDGLWKKTSGS